MGDYLGKICELGAKRGKQTLKIKRKNQREKRRTRQENNPTQNV